MDEAVEAASFCFEWQRWCAVSQRKVFGPRLRRAFLIFREWAETVIVYSQESFEASEATHMISRQLNSDDSRFASICSNALLRVFFSSVPKNGRSELTSRAE